VERYLDLTLYFVTDMRIILLCWIKDLCRFILVTARAKRLIYQFLKPAALDIGERFALQLGAVRIRVETLDMPWDMSKSLGDDTAVTKIQAAISDALKRLTQTAEKRFYDVLILDEIVFCLSGGNNFDRPGCNH